MFTTRGATAKLTNAQQETLRLLRLYDWDIKKVAQRRGVSTQSIYQIIRRIEQKGFISRAENFKHFCEGTPENCKHFRVHGLQYIIQIIYKSQNYANEYKPGIQYKVDGNTILLHKNSISIFSDPEKSFIGKDEGAALQESLNYMSSIIRRIEVKYNLLLLKPGYDSVRLCKFHIGHLDNEIAKDKAYKYNKLRIKGIDGKTWLLIDNSFNLDELELVHPTEALQDSDKVKTFLNALRENKDITNPEVYNLIGILTKSITANSQILNTILELIKNQIPNTHALTRSEEDKPDYIQ